MLQLLEKPPTESVAPAPEIAAAPTKTQRNESNHLIFICDANPQGQLNCRWIQGCLL